MLIVRLLAPSALRFAMYGHQQSAEAPVPGYFFRIAHFSHPVVKMIQAARYQLYQDGPDVGEETGITKSCPVSNLVEGPSSEAASGFDCNAEDQRRPSSLAIRTGSTRFGEPGPSKK